MPAAKAIRYRFDDFEADLGARTLAQAGHAILLDVQTFDLLALLLAQAPHSVSEVQLTRALWPGMAVEESNLGQHIFLLRRALSGAERGEKIIVATGQGYRFAAELEEITPRTEEALRPARTVDAEKTSPHSSSQPVKRTPATAEPRRRTAKASSPPLRTQILALASTIRKSRSLQITLAIAAILIVAAVLAIVWSRSNPKAAQPLHLLVAGIQNSTPDPQFDESLRTALIADLRQSPHLILPGEDRIVAALVKINAAPAGDSQATRAIPQQLCHQLKSDAYLTGNLRRVGQKYLIAVTVFGCARGEQLATTRGIADSPEHLVGILDRVALSLRAQLGENKETIQRFNQQFFPSGNISMPALKAYADGAALALDGKSSEAITLLRRAISIDSHFALAEEDLGLLQWSIGDRIEGAAHLTRAYQLRDTVNAYDRFNITGRYTYLVPQDLQAALRNFKEAAENYPHSPAFLAGMADLEDRIGKSAFALDPARQAIALDPDNATAYEVLAAAQMHLGQFEEAVLTCRHTISREIDTPQIHSLLLQIAFQRLDQSGIDEQLAWARGKPQEPKMLVDPGFMEMAQGKVKSAEAIFTRAIAGLRAQGDSTDANVLQSALPRRLAELGLPDTAEAQLERVQQPSEFADAIIAWAELGESSRASSLLKEALAARPAATLWQQLWAPQVRAAIAINQHAPGEAIDALQAAASYDLAAFDVSLMRGRAYLALHQPELAEAEFHKILDHPGIDPLSQNYPLAQLGLARSLAAEDKTAEAGFAYKIVLQIWKDADTDLPRLREAKTEYARLNGAPVAIPPKPHRR